MYWQAYYNPLILGVVADLLDAGTFSTDPTRHKLRQIQVREQGVSVDTAEYNTHRLVLLLLLLLFTYYVRVLVIALASPDASAASLTDSAAATVWQGDGFFIGKSYKVLFDAILG